MIFFFDKKLYLNISKITHFDILTYIFFIKKNFMKKNLVIFGPKNKTWPKLKKYDIYGKKLTNSTNLYFLS